MESVYWVVSWACHRKCAHCYDDRFRPYVREKLDAVVAEGVAAYAAILANLPDDFTYLTKAGRRQRGRLILAGGEVLMDPVREQLFYPVLEAAGQRWDKARAPKISIQTTGDLVTAEHIQDMLQRGVWMIAISGMDDFHVGLEGDKRAALMDHIRVMMEHAGVQEVTLGGRGRDYTQEAGPFFLFFGADPKSWIGELWPRGRAWTNGLSNAGYETNFCARQSGGKRFLDLGQFGSEIAIEPNGAVYPCCMKTKTPLGNLTEERLTDILASLRGHPAFEAINAGDPEAMGEAFGWSRAEFKTRSQIKDAHGRDYANMCIGCDRFFEERLSAIVQDIRRQRLTPAQ